MRKSRRNVPEDGPATDTTHSAEWIRQVSGEDVHLAFSNGYTRQGLIAGVTLDGSAFWIGLSADDVTITPTY